jgi:hypothetical protein
MSASVPHLGHDRSNDHYVSSSRFPGPLGGSRVFVLVEAWLGAAGHSPRIVRKSGLDGEGVTSGTHTNDDRR